ncbi:hypothetical protein FB567DRAFT_349887 [Paraphoma chrysanthemicola]|uniref:J domain-containing protein n=1 Tax=Paraphoma chrysanthemicola TaxID=798071 RepID=A0A8K0R5X9_9PLEO|nr:hypothetical protein FB567DRAFT_349887 [Paraphoma chrysanthemicola]
MSTATYYQTLGVLASAPPEVIRAAYKALALVHHPDKTLHLPAGERASHAKVFREVQEAYDVISNHSLKAQYDAELARHNNKVDEKRSTFHRPASSRSASARSSSCSARKAPIKLTTPEEKVSMRAKARQSLEHLREQRAERETQDAELDVAALMNLVQIWSDLAVENKTDPSMQAHCAIRVHEYEQKIVKRRQEHEEPLAKMSPAKQNPTSTTRQHRSQVTEKHPTPPTSKPTNLSNNKLPQTKESSLSSVSSTPLSRTAARAEERKRAEAARIAEAASRAHARLQEKAQRDAARQAQLDQKAAAIRAEKEKHKAKVELQVQKDAARIASARAKAGAAPLGTVGAGSLHQGTTLSDPNWVRVIPHTEGKGQAGTFAAEIADDNDAIHSHVNSLCSKCDSEHRNFRDWRKCNMPAVPVSKDDGAASLRVVQ